MPVDTSKNVIMIDNYDSFTWNLYEYLSQAGANVSVYRNDAITLSEIESMNPDTLVISPGPGHPQTDSGISRDVIEYFKGKIPIFGVCMGQQCIFEVFGGSVQYAGEIVHGKTSTIKHDNKGMFRNVPQDVAVTRYHSLAGTKDSLPDCLEVTATTDNGIIMGVRHKEYVIEGVQFHPESILTEEGHMMMKNILNYRGGYWKDNLNVSMAKLGETILDRIYKQRRMDVEELSKIPGKTFRDLEIYYELGIAPKVKDFHKHIANNGKVSIVSEIKRASPSKGDIQIEANAGKQALMYAKAGVRAISVLTEPHWFKGSIEDLQVVRKVVDSIEDRPCVLRKEFIFSKYQILEARLSGADTVLLIVKMLTEDELAELVQYSRSLGMEPLVEVNTEEELQTALKYNSRVIGVNNRNLHTFDVDLKTTTNVLSELPQGSDVYVLALSGISTVEDVQNYTKQGVTGFLIGEALMRRGESVGSFISELQA